jgi:hypothetical protein
LRLIFQEIAMAREISAESLVALPRLSIDSGLALWQALRAGVAAEKKLPKFLQAPWQNLDGTGEALFQAAQSRLVDSGSRAPSAEKRKADIVVDNAAGALDQFLEAWTRLPDTLPEAQLATAARQALFPDGTGFLRLAFDEEWAQIDRRLALIKKTGIDKQIARLGGTAFVQHLEDAHAAYGKALGLTSVPATPAETVALRDPLLAFISALRLYVIKVAAYRDEDKPETVAVTERLLRPLTSWTSRAARPSGDSESAPGEPTAASPSAPVGV